MKIFLKKMLGNVKGGKPKIGRESSISFRKKAKKNKFFNETNVYLNLFIRWNINFFYYYYFKIV